MNKSQAYISQDKKCKFTLVRRKFASIRRADNLNKPLSIKARLLLSTYSDLLDKVQDTIVIGHKFITSLTECGEKQNNNIHKQLKQIFNIKYHYLVTIRGRKYRNVFCIDYTEQGREILKHPQAYCNANLPPKEVNQVDSSIESNITLYDTNQKKISGYTIYNILQHKYNIANSYSSANFKNLNFRKNKIMDEDLKQSRLKLKDFYPLEEDDYKKIKEISERYFTLQEANSILLDMSKRLINNTFANKDYFIKYFAISLKNERRKEGKIFDNTRKAEFDDKQYDHLLKKDQILPDRKNLGELFEITKEHILKSAPLGRKELWQSVIDKINIEEDIQTRKIKYSNRIGNDYIYRAEIFPDMHFLNWMDICYEKDFTIEFHIHDVVSSHQPKITTPMTKLEDENFRKKLEDEQKEVLKYSGIKSFKIDDRIRNVNVLTKKIIDGVFYNAV